MPTSALIGIVFLAIGAIFLFAARRAGGSREIRSRTWRRLGIIFTIVGLGLQFARLLGGAPRVQ